MNCYLEECPGRTSGYDVEVGNDIIALIKSKVVLAIFDFLPKKHDKRWLIVLLIIAFFIEGVLYASTRFILKNDVQSSQVLWMLFCSVIIASVISLLGYVYAKIWFASACIGLFLGLAMLVTIFLDYGKNGWEDLIGIITFLMLTGIGLVVGGIAELIAYIIRKVRTENKI